MHNFRKIKVSIYHPILSRQSPMYINYITEVVRTKMSEEGVDQLIIDTLSQEIKGITDYEEAVIIFEEYVKLDNVKTTLEGDDSRVTLVSNKLSNLLDEVREVMTAELDPEVLVGSFHNDRFLFDLVDSADNSKSGQFLLELVNYKRFSSIDKLERYVIVRGEVIEYTTDSLLDAQLYRSGLSLGYSYCD